MAIPKVMGTEIEYGITVKGDPDFDPDLELRPPRQRLPRGPLRRDPLGLRPGEPPRRRAGLPGRRREVHTEPAGKHRPQQDARERGALLRRPRPPRVLLPRGDQRPGSGRSTRRPASASSRRQPPRGERPAARPAPRCCCLQEQQRPQGQQLRLARELPDGPPHVLQADRREPDALLRPRVRSTRRGQGGQREPGHPCDYQISQRADFFETEVALDTMVKRPIINTRDEPHADREKYRRLHVIVGDANLSEYTIYLRNGVTALVLSMIEDGAITEPLAARSRCAPSRRSPTIPPARPCCRSTSIAARKLTAVQIQARVPRDGARLRGPAVAVDPITQVIVLESKWEEDPGSPGARPDGAFDDRIDWVMKKAMIEGFMERKGLDWEAPRSRCWTCSTTICGRRRGCTIFSRRQGRAERIVTDEEINPGDPGSRRSDTRAYFRGECLKRYGSCGLRRELGLDLVRRGRRADQADPDGRAPEGLEGPRGQQLLESSPTASGSREEPARLGPSERDTSETCASTRRDAPGERPRASRSIRGRRRLPAEEGAQEGRRRRGERQGRRRSAEARQEGRGAQGRHGRPRRRDRRGPRRERRRVRQELRAAGRRIARVRARRRSSDGGGASLRFAGFVGTKGSSFSELSRSTHPQLLEPGSGLSRRGVRKILSIVPHGTTVLGLQATPTASSWPATGSRPRATASPHRDDQKGLPTDDYSRDGHRRRRRARHRDGAAAAHRARALREDRGRGARARGQGQQALADGPRSEPAHGDAGPGRRPLFAGYDLRRSAWADCGSST